MKKNILVTGGAGFIGSHLVDDLLTDGHDVIVYDSLEPQVHGKISKPPKYLSSNIKFINNDIRNKEALENIVEDVDVIFHLAAMVGVGQSMYQIEKYVDVNINGTAILLDLLVNTKNNVQKLIVASSMSTYGEGRYMCPQCGKINPSIRSIDQLKEKEWSLHCPNCNSALNPLPTDEVKKQDCQSIYALNKKEQEKMCILIGETYGINTTALRFFNVYGSRQSLSNPYTGVCAIFSSRLLSGKSPIIFEDGNQTRDFIHVKDITKALVMSMEKKTAKGEIFNVGTGKPTSIKEIAKILSNYISPKIQPTITNEFRSGDIRHCFADITKISNKLGFEPEISLEKGMKSLVKWIKNQKGNIKDKTEKAYEELHNKGLLKS